MQFRFPFIRFWSACLGNLFEHYDTALYGLLSPFLAPLFFPKQDPITALIFTYALIPLGMLARPFGALFFGKIGDFYGRERSLFFSLLGMGVISLALAVCPAYAKIGIWAPFLLCFARISQNFLAAGEIMGGAIFLLENSPEKKHDVLSSLYNASTIGGILLASFLVFLFSYFKIIEQGWRFLYLFGGITAVFGSFFRTKIPQETQSIPSFSLTQTFQTVWKMRTPIAIIALTSGFSYATYSLALVLLNGFIPLISPFTKESMLSLNTLLLVLDFGTLPLFGWLASKIGREKLMFYAVLLTLLTAFPLSLALEGAGLWTIVAVRLCFVFLGVAFFAPYHAFAHKLVLPAHRYLILSFGYALGSQALGSPTSTLSLWIFKETGIVASIAWYWTILAFATLLTLVFIKKKSLHNTLEKISNIDKVSF